MDNKTTERRQCSIDNKTTVTLIPCVFPNFTSLYNNLGSFMCDECGGKGILHGYKFCPWCGREIVEKARLDGPITNR